MGGGEHRGEYQWHACARQVGCTCGVILESMRSVVDLSTCSWFEQASRAPWHATNGAAWWQQRWVVGDSARASTRGWLSLERCTQLGDERTDERARRGRRCQDAGTGIPAASANSQRGVW
jgi:hypothetical protein